MKLQTYIIYLLLLLIYGCQKNYYLDELNEVNNQIETLESQLKFSESERESILQNNATIEAQIIEVHNQLEKNEMTLAEALKKINELEEELGELGKVTDGIYEVVLQKEVIVTKGETLYGNPWERTDPQTSQFIEIQDSEIISHTILLSYLNEIDEFFEKYTWHDYRKLVEYPFYSKDTLGDYYLINLSKRSFSADSILIVNREKTVRYFNELQEIEIIDSYLKLVKRPSFPKIETEAELTEIFKNTGRGFYSDSLYRSLNPSDYFDYIRVFIADAKRHGVDLSHITKKDPYIHFYDEENDACGWASELCDPEKIWIELNAVCWDYKLLEPYLAGRLVVMYHELGHSVLGYNHPMVENWQEKGLEWPENVAGGFNGHEDDIMGYGPKDDWINYYNHELTWNKRLDRFFKGTDHEYFDCTGSKGGGIIKD